MLKMIDKFRYLTGLLDKEGKRKCRILTALSLLSPVADIFSLSVIVFVVRMAAGQTQVSAGILSFVCFMAGVSVAKGLFEMYKCRISNRFLYQEAQKLSVKLYELLVKEDLCRHNEKTPMQALTMVRSDTAGGINIITSCIKIWVNGLTVAGYGAVMIYSLGWIGTVSCVLFLLVMMGVFFYNRIRVRRYGEELRSWEIKTNSQVAIAYGVFKEMKVNDRSQMILEKYCDSSRAGAEAQSEFQYKNGVIGAAAQSLIMAAVFAALAFFMGRGGNLGTILAPLTIYIAAMGHIIPLAYAIIDGMNHIEFAAKSYEELKENFERYAWLKEEEEAREKVRHKKLSFQKGLFVKNLNFRYNDWTEVFRDASVEIPAGYSIAIIGASGIGKTTFLDLILGLLKPQSGEICYDDYDIVAGKDQDGTCRGTIGDIVSHIPQTVFLNGETIRNNVAFFEEEDNIDEDRVIECLKCAQVWKDIERMPEGIHTLIGENGVAVSGGQRQRIALARALYKDFELLIMDEATAVLDVETEKAVIDSIRQLKGNKTLLMVTHHLSLADECDIVYKIENQKIVKVRSCEGLKKR